MFYSKDFMQVPIYMHLLMITHLHNKAAVASNFDSLTANYGQKRLINNYADYASGWLCMK